LKSPGAENIHYIRSHTGRKWSSIKKGTKMPQKDEATATETVIASDGKPSSIVSAMIQVLRENPQGLKSSELLEKVKSTGVSTKATDASLQTYIAAISRDHPDLGISMPKRGFYVLKKETKMTTLATRKRGRPTGRQPAQNGDTVHATIIDPANESILLRDRNRRLKDAMLKMMEAVFLLTE